MCNNQNNLKGDEEMKETTLKEIEENVQKNSSYKEAIINDFKINIKKRGLKKGRVRPRNKTKQKMKEHDNDVR